MRTETVRNNHITRCCGLDFGTSNSTLGVLRDGKACLVPLEGTSETLPTALFYGETAGHCTFGRAAVADYLGGEGGRLMRSIKSVLGTPLMEEKTQIGRRQVAFRSVMVDFIREVRRRAEAWAGCELDSVVQGRPVHFVDDNPAGDQAAEDTLRSILQECGFRHIHFQYEPVAAARHWEAEQGEETLALVADIGGGTSDFSLIRLDARRQQQLDRRSDILANHGIRLGGTDFDRLLSLFSLMPSLGLGRVLEKNGLEPPRWIYSKLATWSQINSLYTGKVRQDINWLLSSSDHRDFRRLETVIDQRYGHHLAADVEQAKIDLSARPQAAIALPYVERGLEIPVTPQQLEEAVASGLERLTAAVEACLADAGIQGEQVGLMIMTGGSTEMAAVQAALRRPLPAARVISCNTFGAVGLGLTREAGWAGGVAA